MKLCGRLAVCAVVAALGLTASAEEAKVAVFDTGASSSAPLAEGSLSKRQGWTRVAEETKSHSFKGDAVLANERLAVVLRREASGADLYAKAPDGWKRRALLLPLGDGGSHKLSSVETLANDVNVVSVDACFSVASGRKLVLPP